MPTYEYECSACSHHFEQFQGINDPPLTACPECGGSLRRLISAGVGVICRDHLTGQNRLSRCGHEAPCCGRENPCERPPCPH